MCRVIELCGVLWVVVAYSACGEAPGAEPGEPPPMAEPSALVGRVQPGPAASPCGTTEIPEEVSWESMRAEVVRSGLGFLEGPVWIEGELGTQDGFLLFSQFEGTSTNGRIYRFAPARNQLDVLLEPIGVNGLARDEFGTVLGASHDRQGLARIDPQAATEQLVPESDRYRGAPFNSINDLVVRSDGHVYFSDPTYQQGPRPGQPVRGYYHRTPSGEVALIGEMNQPNGVGLSPDGAWLYVSGTGQGDGLRRHGVGEDGRVSSDFERLSDASSDGLSIDCAGNLYLTAGRFGAGAISVLSPQGERLGTIEGFSNVPTNSAFGDPEHRTLFVTSDGTLWRAALPIPGLPN